VAMEYYGPLTGKFDVTGAGIGDWANIFLCNGNNNTPDKRGRVSVGATVGVGGPAFSPDVDPAIVGNPTYPLQGVAGKNNITLSASQLPTHSHKASAVSTINPNPHNHSVQSYSGTNLPGTHINTSVNGAGSGPLTGDTSLSIETKVTIENTGNNLAHSNIQPVIACYYIIYIP